MVRYSARLFGVHKCILTSFLTYLSWLAISTHTMQTWLCLNCSYLTVLEIYCEVEWCQWLLITTPKPDPVISTLLCS